MAKLAKLLRKSLRPIFEAGIKITLPDISGEKESETVKLWS